MEVDPVGKVDGLHSQAGDDQQRRGAGEAGCAWEERRRAWEGMPVRCLGYEDPGWRQGSHLGRSRDLWNDTRLVFGLGCPSDYDQCWERQSALDDGGRDLDNSKPIQSSELNRHEVALDDRCLEQQEHYGNGFEDRGLGLREGEKELIPVQL